MKTRLIPFLLIVACVVAGCKKTAAPPAPAAAPNAAPGLPQLADVQGGNTPAPQTKYFKGSIGSSLDLQMKLVRADPQLTGSYFYQRVGTRINLRGTIDPDGKFVLEEFDPAGKQTGTFKGMWTVDAQDGTAQLAGFWTKPGQKEGDKNAAAFSVHEEPITFSGDAEIVAKSIKEANKQLNYEIDVQYPQIAGGANPNFEKFNQVVRALVTKKVAEFKKDVQPKEGDEPPPEGSMGSDIGIGYEVAMARDDLISVEFDVGSYYQGAAHPNTYTETLNYDLKNGKPINLSDLFKPGAKYLQTLAQYCIADLKKQSKAKDDMLPDDEIQNGAGPSAKNYRSWKITRKGLGINFDAYQVGPYAAGPQYLLVPYANLKDVISTEGPIAGVLMQ
ncbi:MAG TPA: DUF3298 and DUF4163 domain-containing protein [Pyrinomonadaceae bacterium]